MNITEAIEDPQLFAPWFKDPATWAPWRIVLRTLFGLKLSKAELATFKRHTGRTAPAKGGYREAWFICGRGGGKSFTLALCAVYLACFRDWRQYMVPGERGVVMVIAVDRKQAAGIFEYMRALLEVPMMLPLVQRVTQESIDLVGGISIEVHTCNYRSVRGRTIVAALLDEVAFWQSEDTANPDQEVIRALRPGLGRVPGSLLLCASTPYARKGALHQTYTRDYGKDDSPRLVWKATTQEMNCTFSQQVIDDALAEDEPHARAEYFAEFRSDVEQYIKLDTVLACCESYAQRFPTGGIQYQAFVDPSGGNSDSFTAAVGHRQDGKIHVDWLYECRAPFSPEEAVAEICNELRSYNVRQVVGDNYAGEWPKDAFARHAVQYRPASLNKSGLYKGLLPLLNSRAIVLPTNDAMVRQIVGLERRNSYGPEKIDHRPGARDDVANCIAGLAELCRDYNQHPQPAFGRWGSHADAGESPLWYTPPHLRKPSPSRFDGPVPELGKNAFASSVGGTFERQPGAYKQARKTTKGSKWE